MDEPGVELHADIAVDEPTVVEVIPDQSVEHVAESVVQEEEDPGSTEGGESVLQLNLTGDSLQKFAKILHEKGIQTAEDAIQYFFNLHNKGETGDEAAGTSAESTTVKPRGRPKGSRNKGLVEREKRATQGEEDETEAAGSSSWESPARFTLIDGATAGESGTVLVDGVRKSTRKRMNPFVKSEYVPVSQLEKSEHSDEDEEDWNVEVEEEEDYEDEEDYDGLVQVDVGVNPTVFPSPSVVPNQLPEVALAGDNDQIPKPAITIIQAKKKVKSLRPNIVITSKRKGRKVGRPRKRAKEAILFKDEEESQNCGKCGEHFETLPLLRAHKMDAHSRPNHPYFCEHCNYTAMFDCDMKRHQLVHVSTKQFRCEICEFSTNWERNINLHMVNVHSNKEPWKCDRCDVKIYNHGKVKQHQLSHNPNAYRCDLCEFLFETEAKLTWHLNNMHLKENEKLQCTECPYTSTTSVNMKLHLKNKHNIENRQREKQQRRKKQAMCEVCNKRLINDEQKEVHMQIHEPDNRDSLKPYYCDKCDARCADINQMVRHRAIHREDKPFTCKHCNYKSRWKKDLKTHEMIHTGVKNVHCPHCSYTCYTRQRLRAHLVKHDESRHHLCPLCNMAFKSKQALRMHTMYHTGEAAFSCDICDFRTVTEMRLRKHKLRHTDERNHSCSLCGKRFKQPHHVTQHRDIVHLGKPSYRERKRIALQQSAAEALGSLNASDINFAGKATYTVVNEDGTTTLLDLQTTVQPAQRQQEDTQYVMVETPAGYQYVAVVMPEEGQQGAELQAAELVGDGTHVTAEATTLDDTQILLTQATSVYYTAPGENNQAVDTLVALQPQ